MNDPNAFERLVAEETLAEAGPSRPTDVAAVVRSVAAESSRWRFRSMFDATKMLAGTAVVALLAGGVAVGSLIQRTQDPATGAAEAVLAAPKTEPVEFVGRWVYGGGGSGTSERTDEGWYLQRDTGWSPIIVDAGDPRLDGHVTLMANGNSFGTIEIWNGYFRIENDDGAWQQRPMIQSVKRSRSAEPMSWTAVFDGEGAYAGDVAIMGITRSGGGWDVEGLIVEDALPPEPEIRDFYD